MSVMIHNLLPDIGELHALVNESAAFTGKCNAHIHLPPNFSAFESVAHALDLAVSEQIAVLGVSNYYDYSIYSQFARESMHRGIYPLFGIEVLSMQDALRSSGVKVNDPGNPGKTYLCGKGITPTNFTDEAQRLLAGIRRSDSRRMAEMIGKLAAIFAQRGVATGLDHEAVIDRVVHRHGCVRDTVYLQERHAAQAFQEKLYELTPESDRAAALAQVLGREVSSDCAAPSPVVAQNEIRSHLMKAGKPAFVDESYIAFEVAVKLVRELRGIPCYPVLADGTSPICGFEASPKTLIDNLRERGIHAAEFIPVRNSPEVLSQYVFAMREAGLVITAGTEHNTLDLIPIEPTCVKGVPIPSDVVSIFREGACVAAAHQYLTACGEPGFRGGEAEIQRCAPLGAAVIRRSIQQSKATT